MKIILDTEPQYYSKALEFATMAQRDYPLMKTKDVVLYNDGGVVFRVTRNQDSYTVDLKG